MVSQNLCPSSRHLGFVCFLIYFVVVAYQAISHLLRRYITLTPGLQMWHAQHAFCCYSFSISARYGVAMCVCPLRTDSRTQFLESVQYCAACFCFAHQVSGSDLPTCHTSGLFMGVYHDLWVVAHSPAELLPHFKRALWYENDICIVTLSGWSCTIGYRFLFDFCH